MSIIEVQSFLKYHSKDYKSQCINLAQEKKFIQLSSFLKKAQITIDESGSCQFKDKKLVAEISNYLDNDSNEILNKIIIESGFFNNIFAAINSDLVKIDNSIIEGHHDVSFLISTELTLRNINKNIEKKLLNVNETISKIEEELVVEKIIETTGTILNYLRYKKKSSNSIPIYFNKESIDASNRYIDLANIWNSIKEIVDIWAVSDVNIVKEGDFLTYDTKNNITIDRLIAQQLYSDVSVSKEVMYSIKEYVNGKHNIMKDILSYKHKFREILKNDSDFLKDVLFIGKANVLSDIPVSYILIAYECVKLEAKRFLLKSLKKKDKSSIIDFCIVKDEDYWVEKFLKAGIPINYTVIIFKLLTYSNSRDLLDCPFYKIGKSYLTVPSIAKGMSVPRAMLSNLNNRQIEISYKGQYFENYLINIIKGAGLKHTTFKKKVNGENYQCDLIFEISGDVFFVEAKNNSPASSFRDYDKNIGILKNACNQLGRIVDYILQFENITEMLGISEVKSLQKLVVSSIPIGRNFWSGNTIITDELYFSGYFKRRAPKVNHFDGNDKKYIVYNLYPQFYTGEISKKQFLELLDSSPLSVSFEEKRIGHGQYKNERYKFTYEYYETTVDSLTLSGGSDNLSYTKYI